MNAVEVSRLSYRYGRTGALRDVNLNVPEGALYALLGSNGSGKTTLLQILTGLRRANTGRVSVLGVETSALTARERRHIGYIAEGQSLPGWMRLREIEAYLAPLYDSWDPSLARELRERFELDPERRIRNLSRGEQMKAALLCALAPRPRLLVMDEPFTGMDALVKDELVRGLLESAGSEGWTVVLCSHDIGELELLADWVGIIDRGTMLLSEPMDALRARFEHVELTLSDQSTESRDRHPLPEDWLSADRSGSRMSFVLARTNDEPTARLVATELDGVAHVESRGATLREVFVALARQRRSTLQPEVAA